MKDLLKILNELTDNNLMYNILHEHDQLRVEILDKDGVYINWLVINEESAMFIGLSEGSGLGGSSSMSMSMDCFMEYIKRIC